MIWLENGLSGRFLYRNHNAKKLDRLLKGRKATPRERVRARIVLLSHAGWDRPRIAEATGSSTSTVGRVRRQYCEEGLAETLGEKPRPGAPAKLTPRQEQEIIALVCTDPPEGFARWSVRLLNEEVIRRGIGEPVSDERIRVVLRDHGLLSQASVEMTTSPLIVLNDALLGPGSGELPTPLMISTASSYPLGGVKRRRPAAKVPIVSIFLVRGSNQLALTRWFVVILPAAICAGVRSAK